jgi:hypothetical protein
MVADTTISKSELLLWTILRNFELLALKQYEKNVAVLATAEKRELVDLLNSQAPSDEALEETSLTQSIRNLLNSATGPDEVHTLIVQGLLLETLGRTIYQIFENNTGLSASTRELCKQGIQAGSSIKTNIYKLISERMGLGEQLFQTFVTVSRPVIVHLDALGERMDSHFNERFNVTFADLMGEFVAELVPICVELGVERRKIVGHLTSVLMGI